MSLVEQVAAGFARVAAEIRAVRDGPCRGDRWLGVAATVTDASGTTGFPLGGRTFYMRIRRCPPELRITRIALHVATSAGSVSVAAHRSTGTGIAAAPGAQLATSGALACPAAGPYVEIPLGGPATVSAGDWLALSCDSILAAFGGITLQAGAAGQASVNDPWVRAGAGHPAPATPALSTVPGAARAFTLLGIP